MQFESSGALKYMVGDEPLNHVQQYEQAIATIIACRTIIKYDTPLRKEQKDEIVVELDTVLQFLQKRLVANSAVDAFAEIPPFPPLQPEIFAELMADDMEEALEGEVDEAGGTTAERTVQKQEAPEPLMHNLYKLYHSYLSMEPGKGIQALVERYKRAMELLDEVRLLTAELFARSTGERIGRNLSQVQGFISAIYSMFQEFSAVLASILENKNIMIETEELTSLQKYAEGSQQHILLRDVSPLLRAYGAYMQFQQHRGGITRRVSDALAFFIFLEDKMGMEGVRKQEMIEQLRNVSDLLHEISSLLVEFEQAFSKTLAT
jgi:hypothetical protein